jgi:hypothetical protein
MLSRLLGYATRSEMDGARLDDRQPWVVPATRNGAAFLRALPSLLPEGGFVYFEATTDGAFASWGREHAVAAPLKIAYGTIWPRPDWFHIPLAPSLLEEAAALTDEHRIALPSIHVHVHDGTRVLLQWHDAFIKDPIYVASTISRERVESFAERLGVGPVRREAV